MQKNEKSSCIFETTDKFDNYIFLTRDTWDKHIVKKHPVMAGEEKKVKKTIESPDYIYEDRSISTTRNYYSTINSTRLKSFGNLLKVSVGIDNGNIKSAFPVDKISSDGKQIYSKGQNV